MNSESAGCLFAFLFLIWFRLGTAIDELRRITVELRKVVGAVYWRGRRR